MFSSLVVYSLIALLVVTCLITGFCVYMFFRLRKARKLWDIALNQFMSEERRIDWSK